jgi:hypothetical protein
VLSGVGLCEEIRQLQSRGDEGERDGAMLNVMMRKMTINLNIFSAFMKELIVSNLNNTLVITIHRTGVR